jgi:hypothetical protein
MLKRDNKIWNMELEIIAWEKQVWLFQMLFWKSFKDNVFSHAPTLPLPLNYFLLINCVVIKFIQLLFWD